jgi:hypothetical protein
VSVRRKIHESPGVNFIKFACSEWMPLFEMTDAYDIGYNWFDFLKQEGHFILGYFITPNHLQAIVCCSENKLASTN